MGVPLERRSHGSFYRRKGSEVIFDDDAVEAEKRRKNREWRVTQQESPIFSPGDVNDITQSKVGSEDVRYRPKRRTRGDGRSIKNPK